MRISITPWGLGFLFAAFVQLVFIVAMIISHPSFNLPRDQLLEDAVFVIFLAIPFCAGFAVAKTKIERDIHA